MAGLGASRLGESRPQVNAELPEVVVELGSC